MAETKVYPRQCGGFLGIFDDGSLRFGVTADTEYETWAKLDESLRRWRPALPIELLAPWFDPCSPINQ